MGHRNRASQLVYAGALLSGALMPARAVACSLPLVAIEASYPPLRATDVPTNAVLFAAGPDLNPDDLVLLDPELRPVPIEVRAAAPSGFDVVPLAELAPNQRYRLQTPGDRDGTILFTTGSGPAPVPERLEAPALDARVVEATVQTCQVTLVCLGAPPAPRTMLEVRIGDEVLLTDQSYAAPRGRAYGESIDAEDCIEVRARDLRGNRSAPSIVCGADVELLRLRGAESGPPVVACDYDAPDGKDPGTHADAGAPRGDSAAVEDAPSDDGAASLDGRGCTTAITAPIGGAKRSSAPWSGAAGLLALVIVTTLARRRGRP